MSLGFRTPAPSGGTRPTLPVLSLVLFLAACGSDGTGPTLTPDSIGTSVTDPGAVHDESTLAWSVDGTEIYFSAGEGADHPMALMAVRVSDGTVRTVDTDSTERIITDHAGEWIYRNGGGTVDRVSVAGGAAEAIARDTWAHNGYHTLDPVLSPDDQILAYAQIGEDTAFGGPLDPMGTMDTLVLHDLGTGERTAVGFGMPLAFSPDGGELAFAPRPCLDRATGLNPCETRVMDLSDGSTRAFTRLLEVRGPQVRWTAAGLIELVYSWGDGWLLRNLTAGTDQVFDSFVGPYQRLAVSEDATRFAGWDYQNDELGSAIVVVYDLDDGAHTVAIHEEGHGTALAFGPGGDRIAYVVDGTLYVKELPDAW
jgi:hypothetical protein